MKIDGRKIASNIINNLKKADRPNKILAAVLVGDNAQSKSFLKQKERIADLLDVPFHLYQFDESIIEEDLNREIEKIGADEEVGGIIIQLPLPPHYNRGAVLAAVDPRKDVDALAPESRELVLPPPVEVVNDILQSVNYDLKDKVVAVVGRGFLVGHPLIEYFQDKCAELLAFDSKSDLTRLKKADLVITGVGKSGLIKPDLLNAGVGVIDFGYDIKNDKISGDLDASSSSLLSSLSFYTPTPGGTGPVLVAEIFKNFYKLNK
jgi:methylenetetrahydrofolate dehydrogenase (NADP+) / methenyltetrahydrofolate cyclohydrolase